MGLFPIRRMAMMKLFAIWIFKPVMVVLWLIHLDAAYVQSRRCPMGYNPTVNQGRCFPTPQSRPVTMVSSISAYFLNTSVRYPDEIETARAAIRSQ